LSQRTFSFSIRDLVWGTVSIALLIVIALNRKSPPSVEFGSIKDLLAESARSVCKNEWNEGTFVGATYEDRVYALHFVTSKVSVPDSLLRLIADEVKAKAGFHHWYELSNVLSEPTCICIASSVASAPDLVLVGSQRENYDTGIVYCTLFFVEL
jgi:hypothetical protein